MDPHTDTVERHPYYESDGPIAFAHRGGHDAAPENTLAAFDHAVSLGYRYLETDVHRTRDGALVSFHDADLRRTCGLDARIAEMTAAEVANARVDGEHRIPLMEELLERFPTARFNIDAKSDESVEPLAELIRAFGALDRVCLASFNLSRIQRLRSLLGPQLLTNMSSTEVAALRTIGRVPGRFHRAAQVPVRAGPVTVVTRRFVATARSQGIAVHVWTINDRPEMEQLLDLGVDGIMTDETALLREVFIERGHWFDR
jgi:glycerophosphoryl diester phosphodiesterase